MSAKRKTLTVKLLNLIDAILSRTYVEMNRYEIAKRAKQGWAEDWSVTKAIDDLFRRGYLEEVEISNKKQIRLSNKGKIKLLKPYRGKKPNWDGRWRIIAFDIPEKRKGARKYFRNGIKYLGFKYMQKSLWVCPYDFTEKIEELIDILDIEKHVDYFITEAITNEDRYLNAFRLNIPFKKR